MSLKKHVEEKGERVPIWIISFADMITLLLAFFVMLQTLAKSRDNTLMAATERGFVQALDRMGLPDFFFEADPGTPMDYRRLRYPTDSTDDTASRYTRVIDYQDDVIRHSFQAIVNEFHTTSSDQTFHMTVSFPVPVEFAPSSDSLDARGQEKISELANQVLLNLKSPQSQILILGMCPYGTDVKDDLMLASRRAGRVETLFRHEMAAGQHGGVLIRSWGVIGEHDDKGKGSSNQPTQVMVNILEPDENR